MKAPEMKIFFVNTHKKWGGGEKWHLDAALAMKKRGHHVTILAARNKDLIFRAKEQDIRTLPIHVTNTSFLNLFNMVYLVKLLKKEKPHIIILNLSADLKTVGIAARISGIKNIVYRRGSAAPVKNTCFNRILFRKIVDLVIANSKETRRSILQNNNSLIPVQKIKIIYNGIDLDAFDHLPLKQIIHKKEKEIIIGSAGRLIRPKGFHFLIQIAEKLKTANVDFRMAVAGTGPDEYSLKQLVHKAGLDHHFIFCGFVDQIRSFMKDIDIFAFASLSEGFGYVLIEAMASGKPVIAFNNSSIPEIVVNNETGFIVPNRDIDAFVHKVEALVHNPELRNTIGMKGRKRVEDHFSQIHVQNDLELQLYKMMNSTNQ